MHGSHRAMRSARVRHVERSPKALYRVAEMSVLTQNTPLETRQSGGFTGGIAALAESKLYALQNPYKLDGRVSSYPASARGYAVANCYLLKQPDAAMLIDTGFGKDEQLIISQIESLIVPKSPLSLFPLRLNEFMSINN